MFHLSFEEYIFDLNDELDSKCYESLSARLIETSADYTVNIVDNTAFITVRRSGWRRY